LVNTRILIIVAVVAVLGLAALFMGILSPTTNVTTQNQSGMTLTSSAFNNGEQIPTKYGCDGEKISPPLAWANAPAGTRSFLLIVDDPDAPRGTFTHWVIFNIPASVTSLPEDVPTNPTLSNGATQGQNGAGRIGYTSPCPPSGTHRYMFQLYALDTQLTLAPGATKQDVLDAMQGHIIGQTILTGLYTRS
jgi:Raf kinase inhibitor-like YbhB/YbcL family protein